MELPFQTFDCNLYVHALELNHKCQVDEQITLIVKDSKDINIPYLIYSWLNFCFQDRVMNKLSWDELSTRT